MEKKKNILSYIIYFLGVIEIILSIIPSGVRSFLWGMFGISTFLLGILVMVFGVFINKRGFINLALLGFVIFLISSCGFFQCVLAGFPKEKLFATLILDGKNLRGGGFFAFVFGWSSNVVCLIFMGLGLITVAISFLKLPHIKLPEIKIPKIEKEEKEEENIDIPLDDFSEPKIVEEEPVVIEHNEPVSESAFERILMGFKKKEEPEFEPEPELELEKEDDDFFEPSVPRFEDNVRTTTAFSNFDPSKYAKKPESVFKPVVEEEKPIEVENRYIYPGLNLLNPVKPVSAKDQGEIASNSQKRVDVLNSFGVPTHVVDTSRGPTVTRYELLPEPGVRISRITGLSDDIAMNLAATSVRIEAPIPGKSAIGIEIPNRIKDSVGIKEVLESDEFQNAKGRLTVALGKDISGSVVTADIAKMPHLLVAGTTGSGKSVCLNAMIISLLYRCSPDEVKFLMIDPKMVEFSMYNGMPHLAVPVVSDPKKAAGVLGWAVKEMENRYQLFAAHGVRDMESYNRAIANYKPSDSDEEIPKPMPNYVIIIDELADLMVVAGREVENSIQRLTQKARAAGMHLVVATQRPSVDVITGVIKNNIPSRIALTVSSQIDSRTILDCSGAEKLLGHGDMLFNPVGASKPVRIQGCFVSDEEIDRVKAFVSKNGANYDEGIEAEIEKCIPVGKGNANGSSDGPSANSECDPMLDKCIEVVIESGMASTSLLQRKCALGYARAARIIDEMEARGIVGPFEGSKPRPVLLTKERWMEMKLNKADQE